MSGGGGKRGSGGSARDTKQLKRTGVANAGREGLCRTTGDVRGHLTTLRSVRTPRRLHSVHFHRDSTLRLRGGFPVATSNLDLGFNDHAVFSSTGFVVPLNTGITVAKSGKAKGASLLGVVSRHTSKLAVSPGTRVNCFARAKCGFGARGSILSFVRRRYRCAITRVHTMLTSVKVKTGSVRGGLSSLSKNRVVGLLLSGVLLKGCGVLLVSRPKGCLSLGDVTTLRAVVGSCTKAVVFMSRSGRLISGVTSVVCRVGSRGVVGAFRESYW